MGSPVAFGLVDMLTLHFRRFCGLPYALLAGGAPAQPDAAESDLHVDGNPPSPTTFSEDVDPGGNDNVG